MQAGLFSALVAVGAHLGHAPVVERPGLPSGLDPGSDRRDPGPGLARMNGRSNRQLRQVDPTLAGDLDQVERIGGSADEHRRAEGLHPPQSGR